MSQLREVNLLKNQSNNSPKMVTKETVKDYKQSQQEAVQYINNVAALLQRYNEQVKAVSDSYHARQQAYMDSMRQ